jgi:hypothetical protein
MSGRSYAVAGLMALLVCGLIAAGCGGDDDDETTTTGSAATTTDGSAVTGAEQTVDSAVQSCSDQAQQLGGTAGTALESACKSVGSNAKQALSSGSEDVKQALSKAARSCNSAVDSLPAGQAQDALSKLCDSIAGAE